MAREAKAALYEKPRLLVVDDEPQIRDLIGELLAEHFEPAFASNGLEAVQLAKKSLPDMILLDIMMPGMDGISACRALREEPLTRHIPVMMLTAADSTDNRIQSFDLGADDFISKPFNMHELTSRVLSKYKRSRELGRAQKQIMELSNIVLDLTNQQVKIENENIPFSPVEFEILKLLMLNENTLVSRKTILDEVWKDSTLSDRVMDAHIVSLRKKLKNFKGELKTVYGTGYLIKA